MFVFQVTNQIFWLGIKRIAKKLFLMLHLRHSLGMTLLYLITSIIHSNVLSVAFQAGNSCCRKSQTSHSSFGKYLWISDQKTVWSLMLSWRSAIKKAGSKQSLQEINLMLGPSVYFLLNYTRGKLGLLMTFIANKSKVFIRLLNSYSAIPLHHFLLKGFLHLRIYGWK